MSKQEMLECEDENLNLRADICELKKVINALQIDNGKFKSLNEQMIERVAGQSRLLSKNAEKEPARMKELKTTAFNNTQRLLGALREISGLGHKCSKLHDPNNDHACCEDAKIARLIALKAIKETTDAELLYAY